MKPVNRDGAGAQKAAVGGWLLVLCALLLVGQPVSVGISASRVLDALAIRGGPLVIILLIRFLATGLGVGAGLALLGRRSGAVAMAKLSLLLSAATDLFAYLTPYVPSSRAPGETTIVVLASTTYYVFWFVYLTRSRRVHDIFGG